MGRIMAIDYGKKRTGVAVTDPLQIIATALDTIETKEVLGFLKKYITQEPVEQIIVGLPKTLSNEDSENASRVRKFAEILKSEFPIIPIYFYDERFTSSMAKKTMIEVGLKKKDRQDKATVDKISATIILQSYMASKRI